MSDFVRPGHGLAGQEFGPFQQTIFAKVDIDQDGVDPVERRAAIQSQR